MRDVYFLSMAPWTWGPTSLSLFPNDKILSSLLLSNKLMEVFKVCRLDTEGYISRLLVLVKATIMAQQGGSNEDGILNTKAWIVFAVGLWFIVVFRLCNCFFIFNLHKQPLSHTNFSAITQPSELRTYVTFKPSSTCSWCEGHSKQEANYFAIRYIIWTEIYGTLTF